MEPAVLDLRWSDAVLDPLDDEPGRAGGDAIAEVIDAARAMGVEIDGDEAGRWIAAMSAESTGSVTMDPDTGVYGHRDGPAGRRG